MAVTHCEVIHYFKRCITVVKPLTGMPPLPGLMNKPKAPGKPLPAVRYITNYKTFHIITVIQHLAAAA